MPIKLLITDLDGTLLKQDKELDEKNVLWSESVSNENIEAINLAKNSNIDIAIATGRMYGQLEHIDNQLNNEPKFIITQNGNYTYDLNRKIVKSHVFNKEQTMNLVTYLRDFGFKPVFSDKDTIYIDLRYINYDTIKTLKEIYTNNYIKMLNWNDPYMFEDETIKPNMISLDTQRLTMEQMQDLVSVINQDIDYATATISNSNVIDIFPKHVSKAQAILDICKELNYSLDEIAYIGDSGNDVSAMQLIDCSFAMSHSQQEVNQHASYIVESVAQAINEIIFKGL